MDQSDHIIWSDRIILYGPIKPSIWSDK